MGRGVLLPVYKNNHLSKIDHQIKAAGKRNAAGSNRDVIGFTVFDTKQG
jgi:hypothetical protein